MLSILVTGARAGALSTEMRARPPGSPFAQLERRQGRLGLAESRDAGEQIRFGSRAIPGQAERESALCTAGGVQTSGPQRGLAAAGGNWQPHAVGCERAARKLWIDGML